MNRARPWLRDIGLGVAALTVHFLIDGGESWVHVQQALRRVQASTEGRERLIEAVTHHVAGTLVGYLLIGVWAGLALHAWQELARPARPVRAGAALLVVSGLLGNLLEMIRLPGQQDWFMFRAQVVALVPWQAPVLAFAGILLGTILSGVRRAPSPRDFAAHLAMLLGLLSVPFALWHVPSPPASRVNDGPNVLVLSFDALRPDHLGYFGYTRPRSDGQAASLTPHLDAFLRDAAVWTDAITPLARTWPAWAALLTGDSPPVPGYRDPLPAPAELTPRVPTLPQRLHDAGWTTAFRTDDSRFSYMVPEWGWDRIEQPAVTVANFAISGSEPRFRAFLGLLDNPVGWALVPVIRQNQAFGRSYRNGWFNRDTLSTLADLSTAGRFFYAVHDCTLHAPADRHYPQTTLFGQDDYDGENRFRYMSSGSTAVSDEHPESAEALAAAQNLRLYDAGVVTIDQTFAGIVAELQRSGLWDRSIVVVMSDHGEDFLTPDTRYRYNGPNHGFHPWGRAQYNVLLAIHWPASLAGRYPSGRQDHLASLIDVAPTLTEALGLSWSSEGRSLYDGGDRVLYAETGLSEPGYFPPGHRTYPFRSSASTYEVDPETGRVYSNPTFRRAILRGKDRFVLNSRYKLIWYAMERGFALELFDRTADPEDTTPLADGFETERQELWDVLAPRLRADGETVPDDASESRPLPPRRAPAQRPAPR